MKKPKITIVTPSYNQNDFLEDTILSVISQNYQNIEYIIIDGGSTDGSVDTIKKYEKNLSFWVSEKDGGQSDAIHKGFKMATGDIICWLNSDDFFVPGALLSVAQHFESNDATEILIGDGMYSDVNGNITKYYRYIPPVSFLSKHGVIAFCQQSMFINRRYYLKMGGILTHFHYCMDSEFVYRAIRSGCEFSVMHKASGVFRWHDDMKSVDMSNVKLKEEGIIASKYYSSFSFRRVAKLIYIFMQLLNGNYVISFIKTYRLKKQQQKTT